MSRTFSQDTQNKAKLNYADIVSSSLESLKKEYIPFSHKLEQARAHIAEQERRIAELESLSTVDPVTYLQNHRGFERALTQDLARMKRGHHTASILTFVDMENFDMLESSAKPSALARFLHLIASILDSETRIADSVARLDERTFVILFSNAQKQDIAEKIQTLGMRLNKITMIADNKELQLHASIHMKEFNANTSMEALIPQ